LEVFAVNSKAILLSAVVLAAIAGQMNLAFGSDSDSKPTQFSVSVVSESGVPLEGASILVSVFQKGGVRDKGMSKRAYFQGTFEPENPLRVNTDSLGIITIRADKPGYYTHSEKIVLDVSDDRRRYEPWNGEFRITLPHTAHPRPLFVHHVDWLIVPAPDRPIGFDLEKADWVSPYGRGTHSDFVFRLGRELEEGEVYAGAMEVTFSNPKDGIQPLTPVDENKTTLLLGREAPVDGYRPAFTRTVGVQHVDGILKRVDDPPRTEIDAYEGMWFRVRSEIDEATGELKQARYGKLDGFIDYEVRHREVEAKVAFTYYLSPDDSRSLEWNGESLVDHPDLQGITKF
jgi:hypothetical protein